MLIAAAGLAGSGKTTSLTYLSEIGAGDYLYVGGIVRDEVAARGLPAVPASEQLVRMELRDKRGKAALAERADPKIRAVLQAGGSVLLDAICCPDETAFYRDAFPGRVFVIGLDADFATRASRLAARDTRPLTADELARRDDYERRELVIDRVLEDTDITVRNGGSVIDLHSQLRELVGTRFRRAMPGARADRE